jgi:hypothetical protein
MKVLLEGKNAIIYGAGGGIGGGVARAFAREGARVFLAGRTRESLEAVAKEITAEGGSAEVAELDALDERAVDEHAREVTEKAGTIDISFNLISTRDIGSYSQAGENGLISKDRSYPDGIQPRVNPSFTHPYRGQIHTSPRMFIRDGANELGPSF